VNRRGIAWISSLTVLMQPTLRLGEPISEQAPADFRVLLRYLTDQTLRVA
jgi:hypothetical protein